MNLKKTVNSEEETKEFAFEVAEMLRGSVVLMNGNLGAGKTFFVKCVAEYFGCGEVSSPTFTLHHRYDGNVTIRHFDLYRLENFAELENIDFFGIIESGDTCFVEWADKFNLHDELEKYIEITITVINKNERIFEMVTKE